MVKNLPADEGNARVTGSTPGSGRSPGGGHCNPLQYSCLENPRDRGAWGHNELDVTEGLSIHTDDRILTSFQGTHLSLCL